MKKTWDLLNEWEKMYNPFYPKDMRYGRDHLVKFAEFCIENNPDKQKTKKIVTFISFLASMLFGVLCVISAIYLNGIAKDAALTLCIIYFIGFLIVFANGIYYIYFNKQ